MLNRSQHARPPCTYSTRPIFTKRGIYHVCKGSNRNFFPDAVAMLAKSLEEPVVAAEVVKCRRRLDGVTHHLCVRVPVKTAWQTSKTRWRMAGTLRAQFAGVY